VSPELEFIDATTVRIGDAVLRYDNLAQTGWVEVTRGPEELGAGFRLRDHLMDSVAALRH
jgi:hypothetical protein